MVESIRIGSSSNSRTQNRPKYPKILYKKKQFKSLPPASHEVVSDAVGWVASESKACCFPPASQQNGPTALELPSPSIPPTYPGGSASLCVVWLTNGSRPPEWWQAPGLTRDIIEDCWRRLKAKPWSRPWDFLAKASRAVKVKMRGSPSVPGDFRCGSVSNLIFVSTGEDEKMIHFVQIFFQFGCLKNRTFLTNQNYRSLQTSSEVLLEEQWNSKLMDLQAPQDPELLHEFRWNLDVHGCSS